MEFHTAPIYDFSRNLLKPERYPLYGIHIRQPQSPTQAFCLSLIHILRTPPILWIRQDRHFYFRLLFLEELFSLSRKASSATIKPVSYTHLKSFLFASLIIFSSNLYLKVPSTRFRQSNKYSLYYIHTLNLEMICAVQM